MDTHCRLSFLRTLLDWLHIVNDLRHHCRHNLLHRLYSRFVLLVFDIFPEGRFCKKFAQLHPDRFLRDIWFACFVRLLVHNNQCWRFYKELYHQNKFLQGIMCKFLRFVQTHTLLRIFCIFYGCTLHNVLLFQGSFCKYILLYIHIHLMHIASCKVRNNHRCKMSNRRYIFRNPVNKHLLLLL